MAIKKEAADTPVPDLQWEHAPCDWCGSTETELVFTGPDRLHQLPGMFYLCRCRKCNTYRQDPRLTWDQLSAYYPEDYAAYSYSTWESEPFPRRQLNNYGNVKRRRFVEAFQPGGRLLEVGCGTGAFLRDLARSGKWRLEGIEPSPAAADFAATTLSVPIHKGRLDAVDLSERTYDAVVLWCVLEHLTHPIQDLRRVTSLLKDGGWLFFSVPNTDSLGVRIFGPYWSGWDLPRHLYIFPRLLLHRILTELGYDQISEHCVSTSYHALGHSLDFWSQSWEGHHKTSRRLLLSFYRSWITRLGLVLPLALIDRLNLSTNITIAARKKSTRS